jgi:hypothetical protein
MSFKGILAALSALETRLESRQAVTQLHGHLARDIGYDVPEDYAVRGHSALGVLERHGVATTPESDAYAQAMVRQTAAV